MIVPLNFSLRSFAATEKPACPAPIIITLCIISFEFDRLMAVGTKGAVGPVFCALLRCLNLLEVATWNCVGYPITVICCCASFALAAGYPF